MKIIKRFVISSMGVNCYLLECNQKIVLIDAPSGLHKIIQYLEDNQLTLDYVLITHTHFDHILGAQELYENQLIDRVYVAPDEIKLFNDNSDLGNMGGRYNAITSFPGEIVSLDELNKEELQIDIRYIHGHSPQSAVFIFHNEKVIFSGDTLFKDGIGRSDFPGGDAESLIFGIKAYILELSDYKVYSGHGFTTSTTYESNSQYFK